VLGIAGSTVESVAAVATVHGRLVAAVEGPGLNLQATRLVDFYEGLQQLLRSMGEEVGSPGWGRACAATWINLEGILNAYDKMIVERCIMDTSLREAQGPHNIPIESERGAASHFAAFWGETGIVVKAGTGAFVHGAVRSGEWFRAGGWGPLIDADGGGYWVGRTALSTLFANFDRRRPQEREFRDELLNALQAPDEISVARWVSQIVARQQLRTSLSSLAEVVCNLAEQGNRASREILTNSARRIFDAIRAAAKELLLTDCRVALQGGLLQNSPFLVGELRRVSQEEGWLLEYVRSRYRVAVGALGLALRSDGAPGSLENLRESVDNADLRYRPLLLLTYSPGVETVLREWVLE
jgi:N-acetylglucosamine kinase-like BadF-type ATPase